jgi:hypothetical protein
MAFTLKKLHAQHQECFLLLIGHKHNTFVMDTATGGVVFSTNWLPNMEKICGKISRFYVRLQQVIINIEECFIFLVPYFP